MPPPRHHGRRHSSAHMIRHAWMEPSRAQRSVPMRAPLTRDRFAVHALALRHADVEITTLTPRHLYQRGALPTTRIKRVLRFFTAPLPVSRTRVLSVMRQLLDIFGPFAHSCHHSCASFECASLVPALPCPRSASASCLCPTLALPLARSAARLLCVPLSLALPLARSLVITPTTYSHDMRMDRI